jgi:hypothetical protein
MLFSVPVFTGTVAVLSLIKNTGALSSTLSSLELMAVRCERNGRFKD